MRVCVFVYKCIYYAISAMIMCISQIYSQVNGFFVNSYLAHCVVEYSNVQTVNSWYLYTPTRLSTRTDSQCTRLRGQTPMYIQTGDPFTGQSIIH